MLSSKPYPARVPSRPATPAKSLAPPVVPLLAFEQPAPPRANADETHPFRKIVVAFSLAALFVRFGVLPEVIFYITGVNTYLLYITVVPAIAASLLSGGLKQTFSQRAPYWWMAFFGWMVVATPFSFWQGGSARFLETYARTDLVFLVIAGGAAIKWGEIRALFYTIAAASVVNLLTAQFFSDSANGRLSLVASGTIGNSNDLAAHLLLVLPFLLFVTMDPKRSLFIRIPLLLAVAYGLKITLGTASRGALLAVFAGFLFMLWRATPAQRVLAVGGAVLLGGVFIAILPAATLGRLGNLFGQEHYEAEVSADIRSYLFKQSIAYTIEHPLFGVGPGQFSDYEGKERVSAGTVGVWKQPHFIFTQVSADCGIPALIFYVAGLISALSAVVRVHRRARKQNNIEIANACFCYLLAMVGFLVAGSLLPFAYHFYYPAMIGIAVAIHVAGMRTLESESAAVRLTGRPALV
jgi:O-antigen ligase